MKQLHINLLLHPGMNRTTEVRLFSTREHACGSTLLFVFTLLNPSELRQLFYLSDQKVQIYSRDSELLRFLKFSERNQQQNIQSQRNWPNALVQRAGNIISGTFVQEKTDVCLCCDQKLNDPNTWKNDWTAPGAKFKPGPTMEGQHLTHTGDNKHNYRLFYWEDNI